jgi:hypothetical protein
MLFAGSIMSLIVQASKFAAVEWLGFICSIGLGADVGLDDTRRS